jgi:hypothetical protein
LINEVREGRYLVPLNWLSAVAVFGKPNCEQGPRTVLNDADFPVPIVRHDRIADHDVHLADPPVIREVASQSVGAQSRYPNRLSIARRISSGWVVKPRAIV